MSNFGEKLKTVRLAKGWSQETLGKMLDTSKQVISHYENGQRVPKVDVAQRIADVLGVSVFYLSDNSIPVSGYALQSYVSTRESTPDGKFEALRAMYSKMDIPQRVQLLDSADRILQNTTDGDLSSDEQQLLAMYRSLSLDGKKYLMQSATMSAQIYKNSSDDIVPDLGSDAV